MCRRKENQSNVNVREGSVPEAVKLGAYLERVAACLLKAERDQRLGHGGNRWFGRKDVVEEKANIAAKIERETI